jgi:hypothetical protein
LGGILLSIPTHITILIAVFIFFTKGILDWSDGFLAKLTKQTSLKGAVLDPYGALINSLGFQIGLGFYVANNSGFTVYYYLIAVLLFLRAGRIRSFASQFIIKDITEGRGYLEIGKKQKSKIISTFKKDKKFSLLKKIFQGLFDDRARSVDFICLIIIVEMYTGIFISWIIFCVIVLKYFIYFSAELYLVLKKDWIEYIEKTLNRRI